MMDNTLQIKYFSIPILHPIFTPIKKKDAFENINKIISSDYFRAKIRFFQDYNMIFAKVF